MNSTPTEYEEACCLADYCRAKGYLFSHLAQETYTKSWGIKMRNKRQGVNPGVPDYCIIINKRLVFIELKRKKGSQVSPAQRQWIESLNGCEGVIAKICYGANECIEFLNIIERERV